MVDGQHASSSPSVAWRDTAFFSCALLFTALALFCLLDILLNDDYLIVGIPAIMVVAAAVNLLKAWRLFKIRDWVAAKPGMKGDLSAIAGNVGRMHGITTEQKAVRRLRLPNGWSMHPNVPFAGGDIDLVLVSPSQTAYACEIKSWAGLKRKRTMLGFGPAVLVKRSGRPLDADPVEQTLREARALAATGKYREVMPILWVPNGSGWGFRHRGVKVVNGGAWKLKRAVGASWF